jgi:hypothetical protein
MYSPPVTSNNPNPSVTPNLGNYPNGDTNNCPNSNNNNKNNNNSSTNNNSSNLHMQHYNNSSNLVAGASAYATPNYHYSASNYHHLSMPQYPTNTTPYTYPPQATETSNTNELMYNNST